jgi:hypothetical protein
VNFLLHHHLAARDLGRAEAAAGAMLPDVWRMADRRARLRDAAGAPDDASSPAGAVGAGLAHHLAIDAWFHRAPLFLRGEIAAREVLRRARGAAKIGLFAHVAWELCLDGALLRRQGTERVLGAVREAIAAVRPDVHHRVAAARLRLPDADRAVFETRVDRIFDAIAAGPWVTGYATGSGVVERLDGVRARLGFPALSPDDRTAVASGLEILGREADREIVAVV